MSFTYYSDRVEGVRPPVDEEISKAAWGGLVALIQRGLSSSLFAEDFPLECEDGRGIYACDRGSFYTTLKAEIPDIRLPLDTGRVPPTLVVLDVFEFLFRFASKAENGKRHSFFDHFHLTFDRQAGRRQLRDDVNRILSRNGSAYHLGDTGAVQRMALTVVQGQLARHFPPSQDHALDAMLESAVTKFAKPDPHERQVAVQELWDAFERSKTVLNSNKAAGAEALLDRIATNEGDRKMLAEEMRALTSVGNDFRIRHHETGTHEISGTIADYLFARMFALMSRLHEGLR